MAANYSTPDRAGCDLSPGTLRGILLDLVMLHLRDPVRWRLLVVLIAAGFLQYSDVLDRLGDALAEAVEDEQREARHVQR